MAVDTELTWNGDKIIKNVNSGTIKALIRTGNIVHADAVLLAPKRTGVLKGSIRKELLKSKLQEIVYTKLEYAPHVEFGTKHQKAQPYMRPALKQNIKKIEKIFMDEENKAIDK